MNTIAAASISKEREKDIPFVELSKEGIFTKLVKLCNYLNGLSISRHTMSEREDKKHFFKYAIDDKYIGKIKRMFPDISTRINCVIPEQEVGLKLEKIRERWLDQGVPVNFRQDYRGQRRLGVIGELSSYFTNRLSLIGAGSCRVCWTGTFKQGISDIPCTYHQGLMETLYVYNEQLGDRPIDEYEALEEEGVTENFPEHHYVVHDFIIDYKGDVYLDWGMKYKADMEAVKETKYYKWVEEDDEIPEHHKHKPSDGFVYCTQEMFTPLQTSCGHVRDRERRKAEELTGCKAPDYEEGLKKRTQQEEFESALHTIAKYYGQVPIVINPDSVKTDTTEEVTEDTIVWQTCHPYLLKAKKK